jgi:hypothetical protein
LPLPSFLLIEVEGVDGDPSMMMRRLDGAASFSSSLVSRAQEQEEGVEASRRKRSLCGVASQSQSPSRQVGVYTCVCEYKAISTVEMWKM